MNIYFVRHGQTTINHQNRVVSFEDRLNETGQKQASVLAEYFLSIPIDAILASPHKRTMETAGIIAGKLNKDIQEVPLLAEKKWSNEIEGMPLNDPEVERVLNLCREKNASDPAWHYSNEENFIDIKKRAISCIEYFSTHRCAAVLAVSHEYFIKMIVATMIYGESLSFEMFRSFYVCTSLDNASFALCEKKQDTWKLIALNTMVVQIKRTHNASDAIRLGSRGIPMKTSRDKSRGSS